MHSISLWFFEKALAAGTGTGTGTGTIPTPTPFLKIPTTSTPAGTGDPNAIINNAADFSLTLLTTLAYPLAFAAIVYSAYILVSSSGSPDAYAKAKKNVIYLFTGIFLIVAAFKIVGLVIGLVAAPI